MSSRRFLRPLLSAAVACSVALGPAVAHADPCDVAVNNACIDSNTLLPHAGSTRFLSIGGTESLPAGQVSFSLLTSYQSRPVSLLTPSPGPTGTRTFAVSDQITAHFLFAYGITEKLHASFAVPATIIQNGEGLRPLTGGGTLRNQALRDVRFGVGYAFVQRPRLDPKTLDAKRHVDYGLMGRFDVSAPTGDRDAFSTNGTAVFLPSLTGDVRIGRLLIGAEVGLRLRETRESLGTRIGPQLFQAIGVSYDVLGNELLAPYAEFRALEGTAQNRSSVVRANGSVESQNVGGGNAPAEWTIGVRTAPLFGGDFAVDGSGGGGIALTGDDFATPRFRFSLGLRYAPHDRDSDGDGVIDKLDGCPHQKEVVPPGSDAPHDGCVHAAPAALEFEGAPPAATPSPASQPPASPPPALSPTPASPPMPAAPPGIR